MSHTKGVLNGIITFEHVQVLTPHQWRGHGGMGGETPPTSSQHAVRDFSKIDEKIGGGGVVANL